jgi:hypothetical protein
VEKYQLLSVGTTTVTVRDRPAASREAAGFGRYRIAAAVSRTRDLVDTATLGRPRSALLTVATETPAARATSSIVGLRVELPSGDSMNAPLRV